MFCAQCGTLVSANSRFCVTCGSRVTDPGGPVGAAGPGTLSLTKPGEEQLLGSVRRALASDYEVESELGRGGMAVVFKAREKELDRTVALKVLPTELAPIATVAERFKREARLAASLDHPHIIPVYRVGQSGGVLYMAMKYIDGRPLDALVTSHGPLPLPVVLTVLRAAASAIAYAHEHGIVHRDIKGANILIDRQGRVVVSDFGIARAVESATLTATGTMIGTPHYMSPEQCAGKPVGPQSDQYSLGIVTYHMLTGTVPFDGDSLPEILQHHWFTPAPDVSLRRPDIPAALTAVVIRLLAKSPADRFASTAELVAMLDAIPLGEPDTLGAQAALRALVGPGQSTPAVATVVLPASDANTAAPTSMPELVRTEYPVSPATSQPSKAPPAEKERPAARSQPSPPRPPAISRKRRPAPRRWPKVLVGTVLVLGIVGAAFAVETRRAAAGSWTPNPGGTQPPRLDARLMRDAGGKAYQAGDYELARRFFVRAIIADPQDAGAHRQLGCALKKLGRTDSAVVQFTAAHLDQNTACH
jgi:serine/threonine protein kinase